jgi:CBS domain-containing protein
MSSATAPSPTGDRSPRPAARTRPVRDLMRHGVVVCDADVSVRDVARTMRDHRTDVVLAIDISSEVIGLIDESSLLRGWSEPDRVTAAEIADPDPLIADPSDPVGEVARRMLAAGVSRALVAPPPPTEESGRWSEWKERGLPLGTLGVADILGRLDELGTAVRLGSTRPQSMVGRVGPAATAAGILVALALVGLLVFLFAHGHQLTTSPGCSHPTQGGC